MKIFITGGTGFIGSHLIKRLEKTKHQIFVLRKNLADIKKWQNELKCFKPNTAIHLAWEGIPDYGSEMSIRNLNYGLSLFKMLAKIGCQQIITAGSCWEYGIRQGKLSEDRLIKPFNAFTAVKNSLFLLGREIAKENNVQFIWTRLFFVYGPGQRKQSLIPYLISCVRKGEKTEIKNPLAKNDFIFVEDVIEALMGFLDKEKLSGVYNIGSGEATSIGEIIDIVYNQLAIKDKIKHPCLKKSNNQVDNFWADISKIKKDIGWQPKTDTKKGIQKTISYFLSKDKNDQL